MHHSLFLNCTFSFSFLVCRLRATTSRVQTVRPVQVSKVKKRKHARERRRGEKTVIFSCSRHNFVRLFSRRKKLTISARPPFLSSHRYFDPSTDSCKEFPNCHPDPLIEELAWDCGPCSAFFPDGGNGHCNRAAGCSLGGGGGAAATVLAASGRQQKAAAAIVASVEQKQIHEVAERNAVVYNLNGKGSVSVGMPAAGGARGGAGGFSSSAAAASVPSSSSRSPSSSSRSPSPPAVGTSASAPAAAAAARS